MDFRFNEQQTLLQDAVSRFLRDRYGVDKRAGIVEKQAGFDPSVWRDFATSLGLLGATLPKTAGGLGGGPVETMIIMEELGQALVVEPYLETVVIGGGILKRCSGQRASDLLSGIVAGEARIAYAAAEPSARYTTNDVSTKASRDGNFWVLDGMKSMVEAAPHSTHLLVLARISGERLDRTGLSMFIVDKTAPGVVAHDYRLIDGRSASDMMLEGVRVPADALVGDENHALPLIEKVIDEAIAALCAEAVGCMRKMLESTIDYTKQRRQFGQPLASFQVLQHRMVDMYMALEQAVSALYLATLRLDANPVMRAKAVSAAKVTVGQSLRMIAQSAIQLQGGMGMSDELMLGQYFKRATAIESQFGTVDHHLARYAAMTRAQAT